MSYKVYEIGQIPIFTKYNTENYILQKKTRKL